MQYLWAFGVYDGHGLNGHLVSDFIKKNIPIVAKNLIKKHALKHFNSRIENS